MNRKRVGRKQRASKSEHARTADLATALSHSERVRMLALFLERETAMSPKQVATHIGAKLPNVSYHIKVLAGKGALELVEEEPVRGSVAHFYTVTELVKSTPWVLESLQSSLQS